MGAILGANIGYTVAGVVLNVMGIQIQPDLRIWVMVAAAVLFGLLGIFLIKKMIKLALFLAGFLFGAALVAVYTNAPVGPLGVHSVKIILESISLWSVFAGIACGVLFVFFEKGFVVLYTGAMGAYLLTVSLDLIPIVFYVLLVLGANVQLYISRNKRVQNLSIKNEKRDGSQAI